MARHWTEPLDPQRHVNMMGVGVSGVPIKQTTPDQQVYFVAVAGFTFQFASLEQLRECLQWFRNKIHPSSRLPGVILEHNWQRWYERLPKGINKESRREKVVKALENALADFAVGKQSKSGG